MSEPKLISPLLDDFAMGAPMSEHHGVRCCPAMEKDSDHKYIVKIISIPATQTQLDALLLSGAYKDSAAALDYFKALSDGVVEEAEILQTLSQLKGFVPYTRWQVVPMENAVGYDVYLLGPYKRSLERFFRKNTMTHLAAVNLGLDLCAAMTVCRLKGYLYVALKPGNVFISEQQEYQVGDLGFVRLDSLAYASLPDKYRSSYTPPEIQDAMSTLNETMDVYAIGMILYQAFNGGTLPFSGQAPQEDLPAPMYADYEMAEIILKACAVDPAQRWADPREMGQAIALYMQRNGANDVPIVPTVSAQGAEAPSAWEQEAPQEESPATAEKPPAEDGVPQEPDELDFLSDLVSDETAPSEDTAPETEYGTLSGETSDMLFLADELLAQQVPEPVIPPEPIEVPIPEPIPPEPPEPEEPKEADLLEQAKQLSAERPEPKKERPAPAKRERKPIRIPFKKIGITLLVLALLAALGYGGCYYYKEYYLVDVASMTLDGENDRLLVSIVTEADEALLSVECKDAHGNVLTAPVVNGTASFENLTANNQFQITLKIDGFHKLTGSTTDSYNTPAQTNVVQFDAVAGNEDGSVILSFTVDGREPEQWSVAYSAEGEEEQVATFAGHMYTVRGLSLGKAYTFRLLADDGLYLTGLDQVTFTPQALVLAQELSVADCTQDSLTAVWSTPEGKQVASWTVRCYNDAGFDQSQTVTENKAVFTGLDLTQAHTIEVTAEGMVVGTHTYVSANPVVVSNLSADTSNPSRITLSWDYTGTAPNGGWLVLYTVDGSETQQVLPCAENTAEIIPMVPNVVYEFTIQAGDGNTVFGKPLTLTTPEANKFNGIGNYTNYNMTADDLTFAMCLTPERENWNYTDLDSDSYTTTFQVGQKASFLVTVHSDYNYDSAECVTMFLIRDADGTLVSFDTSTRSFMQMWDNSRCELDIPALPGTPGAYTVEVYFNGALAGSESFTMTAAG